MLVGLFSWTSQGLNGSLKTWKVMKFTSFISKPRKSWNLVIGTRRSKKLKAVFAVDKLLQLSRRML